MPNNVVNGCIFNRLFLSLATLYELETLRIIFVIFVQNFISLPDMSLVICIVSLRRKKREKNRTQVFKYKYQMTHCQPVHFQANASVAGDTCLLGVPVRMSSESRVYHT